MEPLEQWSVCSVETRNAQKDTSVLLVLSFFFFKKKILSKFFKTIFFCLCVFSLLEKTLPFICWGFCGIYNALLNKNKQKKKKEKKKKFDLQATDT